MTPSELPTAVLQPGQSLAYQVRNALPGQFLVSRLEVRPLKSVICGPVTAWVQAPILAAASPAATATSVAADPSPTGGR